VGVAEQDHRGGGVDRRGESIGIDPPTGRIEWHVDPTAAAVGDGVEERVVDRREHHHAVATLGRVPQRDLQRRERAGERPNSSDVGPPAVSTLLPVDVLLAQVRGERPVAEITPIEMTA